MGVPTGPHGAFRDYQVDAITLEISSRASFDNKYGRNEFLLRGGRLVLNNISFYTVCDSPFQTVDQYAFHCLVELTAGGKKKKNNNINKFYFIQKCSKKKKLSSYVRKLLHHVGYLAEGGSISNAG